MIKGKKLLNITQDLTEFFYQVVKNDTLPAYDFELDYELWECTEQWVRHFPDYKTREDFKGANHKISYLEWVLSWKYGVNKTHIFKDVKFRPPYSKEQWPRDIDDVFG